MDTLELPKYEGKGALLPVALFEAMARKYFSGTETKDWRLELNGFGTEPVVAINDGLFGKLLQSYYGDGLTLPQERGAHATESTGDTGGDGTTDKKIPAAFADFRVPHMVPKGIAAKKAGLDDDGILTDIAEGQREAGGDSSTAH